MKHAIFMLLATFCFSCVGLKPNPQYTSEGESRLPPPRRETEQPPEYMNPRFESLLREQIDSYLGVPYEWGGMSYRGIDCSGLVANVFRQAVNISLPRNAEAMFHEGVVVSRRHLRFGDLVFFENIDSRGISHVGIYMGDGKFVHASSSQGVVVDDLNSSYYLKQYVGARRIYTH